MQGQQAFAWLRLATVARLSAPSHIFKMSQPPPPAESPKQKSRSSRLTGGAMTFVAAIIWLYVFIKLFVYDIDIYLITKINPELLWIVRFKFFILLGIVIILLLATRSISLLKWTLYVLFFRS